MAKKKRKKGKGRKKQAQRQAQPRTRQEGKGTTEIPRHIQDDWRTLAGRMRDKGWTFEVGRGHGTTAYAPYWTENGVNTLAFPGTPGRGRGYGNARNRYRRWCRENGIEPNI